MSDRTDFESLADWMGEQDWTVNVRDYTDEYETYVREQPVDLLAERIIGSAWLAEHDRQVAERAWDEGYTRGNAHNGRRDDCPYRAAKGEQKLPDPKPWLFISDQVFGEFRSDHDEGYNSVSGTYWTFSPRPTHSQDREDYAS